MKNLLYILIIIMATCLVAGVALLVIPTDSGDTTPDEPVTDVTDTNNLADDTEDPADEEPAEETECEHVIVVDDAVAATCTETGLTEGSHCSVCGAVIVAQELTAALGHDYESVVTASTCTDTGYTTYTCSACGDTYTGDETTATGHNYVSNVCSYCSDTSYWLTFTGGTSFTTIALSNVETVGVNVEISDNTSFWYTWDGSEYTVTDSTVYIRGYDNTAFATSTSVYCNFSGSFTSCSGNIMSLLSSSSPTTKLNASYTFVNLFYECTLLVTAPTLPATMLAVSCYYRMFYNCTSLTTAPSLPATTLILQCYMYMFYGCTSLTTAPSLPATTLAVNCYCYMFCGCTSLTTTPSLPATMLASSCYRSMFRNCISLIVIPSLLHVDTWGSSCCESMFQGCSCVFIYYSSSYTAFMYFPADGDLYCLYKMFSETGCSFSTYNTGYYYTSNETV